MVKKSILVCVMMIMMMTSCAAADIEVSDLLKPVWVTLLENKQAAEETPKPKEDTEWMIYTEPPVISTSPKLEVIRSSVYVSPKMGGEIYIYAQVKNVSKEIICPWNVVLTAYDDKQNKVFESNYTAFCIPKVIEPGETAYITENKWGFLEDFNGDLYDVNRIECGIKTMRFNDNKRIKACLPVKAYIEGDFIHLEINNTTDDVLFDIEGVAAVIDSDGKIVETLCESTYTNAGLMPNNTITLRSYIADHALRAVRKDIQIDAAAYVYSE